MSSLDDRVEEAFSHRWIRVMFVLRMFWPYLVVFSVGFFAMWFLLNYMALEPGYEMSVFQIKWFPSIMAGLAASVSRFYWANGGNVW